MGPTEWFRTSFGELYPILYPGRDDASAACEIERLVTLLALAGSRARVLDLGCGHGRHAVALRRLGLRVTGLDLSPELLALARQRGELDGQLVRGDLRAIPLRAAFDVVLSLFTSFGYFLEDSENERAAQEMARVLRPGGRAVIDHIHRCSLVQTLVPENTWQGAGFRVTQRRYISGSRVCKEIIVTWDDGRVTRLEESVRLYSPEEMAALLARVGFQDVRFFGSFGGDPLRSDAQRMIAVGRKPAEPEVAGRSVLTSGETRCRH